MKNYLKTATFFILFLLAVFYQLNLLSITFIKNIATMRSTLSMIPVCMTWLLVSISCHEKSSQKVQPVKNGGKVHANSSTTAIDSIISVLKNNGALSHSDVLLLDVIDSNYAKRSGEMSYTDTTVQLNDSIFYSIIDITDGFGICSNAFVVTFNQKKRQPVAASFLRPDCDVDYAQDSYNLYEYKVTSKERILLTKKTVFQKKERLSENEEENIDHEELLNSYFLIATDGKISVSAK